MVLQRKLVDHVVEHGGRLSPQNGTSFRRVKWSAASYGAAAAPAAPAAPAANRGGSGAATLDGGGGGEGSGRE